MEAIPADRLVRLLNILEKNIRAAEKMSLVSDPVSKRISLLQTIHYIILLSYLLVKHSITGLSL